MTKDYGEILLESMSTLLEASQRAQAEPVENDKELAASLDTTNPLANFLSNASYEIDGMPSTIQPLSEEREIKKVWQIANYDIKNTLLAIDCAITTSRVETEDISTGNFGIMVGIYADDKVYTTSLDSTKMFGNIYNLKGLPQKMMVSIPENANVKSIGVVCYNNTNNIIFTINRLTLALGEDLNVIGSTVEPFTITCADPDPKYTVTDRDEVTEDGAPNYRLEARYITKDEQGRYTAVTSSSKLAWIPNLSVRWYRYIPEGVENSDSWGGTNWEYQPQEVEGIDEFSFTCTKFNAAYDSEQYKAVLVGIDLETGASIALTSNIIKIAKETVPTEEYIDKIQINLEDKSEGVYPFYDCDGFIRQDLMSESTRERIATCIYETKYTAEQISSRLSSIEWVYNSMSINYLSSFPQDGAADINYQTFIDQEKYMHICFSQISPDNNSYYQFKYSIASQILPNTNPNIITCILTFKDGKIYSATKSIYLNQIVRANGTDYSIITRLFSPTDQPVMAVVSGKENYHVTIDVYDPEGKRVEGLNQFSVKLKYSSEEYTTITNQYLLPALTSSDVLEISTTIETSSTTDEPAAATDSGAVPRKLTLTSIFPIAVCAQGYANYSYRGPCEVVYSSERTKPNYNKSFIELVPSVSELTWLLESDLTDKSLLPEVSVADGKYNFTPIGIYDKNMLNKPIRLLGKIGVDVIWDQPIIITQDRYFSSIINEWDGSLQINNEGNYIMSSAYVAGGKDNENTFTGVVMGELGTITPPTAEMLITGEEEAAPANGYISRTQSPTPTETGIFGYQKGAQSFGLKSDGTAFFGTAGSGRINFDGNGGTISSGNFDGVVTDKDGNVSIERGTTGTFIDLQKGTMITSNGTFRGDLSVNAGDLAGWKLDTTGMYRLRKAEEGAIWFYYYSGINSDTFLPRLQENVPFTYDTEIEPYYITITAPPNLNIDRQLHTNTLEIPQHLNGRPIRTLTLQDNIPKNKTWKQQLPNVDTIRFDSDIQGLSISDGFFDSFFSKEDIETEKPTNQLKAVYLPRNIYYMGSKVFGNNSTYYDPATGRYEPLKVYLYGNVGASWAPDWAWGTEVYYAQGDACISDLMDLRVSENEEETQKMVRFYAGSSKPAPTMAEWTNLGNAQQLFMVADTGEAFMSDATIKRLTVSSSPLIDADGKLLPILSVSGGQTSVDDLEAKKVTMRDTLTIQKDPSYASVIITTNGTIKRTNGTLLIHAPQGITLSPKTETDSEWIRFGNKQTPSNTPYWEYSNSTIRGQSPVKDDTKPAIQLEAFPHSRSLNTGYYSQIDIIIHAYGGSSGEEEVSQTLSLNYYSLEKLTDLLANADILMNIINERKEKANGST